jgi:hypothetical protein
LYLAIFGLLSTRCSSLAYLDNVKRAKIISDLARERGATAISEQHGMSAAAASKPVFSLLLVQVIPQTTFLSKSFIFQKLFIFRGI